MGGKPESGIEVFVFKGGRFLGSRCFSRRTLVVGRGAAATLRLKDASVSDRHAVVRIEGNNVVVADNHSEGGVFVNGARVTVKAVTSFDEVSIGPFRLKLGLLGGEEQEDPGFGDEDDLGEDESAETVVRRVDRRPADPPASRGQRPRAGKFEDVPTRADGVAARSRRAEPSGFDDFSPQAKETRGRSARPASSGAGSARLSESPGPAALAPPPAAIDGAYADDDDDDEDFIETFSLLENVVRERFKAPADTEPYAMTEVIRYRDGEILDLLRADPGQSVRVGTDDFRLVNVNDDGRSQLFFTKGFSGTIVSGGKARPLKRLFSDKYLVFPKRNIYGVELAEGDYAQLLRDDAGYLVRFVRPPTIPKTKFSFDFNLADVQIFAGSAAFHFLILVMLGFVAPAADLHVESDAERFAKMSVKDLKLEKPKEEKKPEPKKEEPKPPPTKDAPKQPVKKRIVKRRARRPAKARQMSAKQKQKVQQKQVSNVLSALQNLKPKAGPGRANLKALTSNIAAVRTPSGTASSFKISGTIGKIPGNSVRLAGGGGGGKDTKVGSQLLRGGKIGKLSAIAGTGSRVRGRVRRAPTRSIAAKGGHLSREAIQKVVSRHMHQVQACYERQLITNPGLSGKIVFDWVISPSGAVSSARQNRSSVRSPAVATCILGLIRSWRFPQPVGGSVQVRYPFVFRVQGF